MQIAKQRRIDGHFAEPALSPRKIVGRIRRTALDGD
jgi:hypothetical protein